MPSNPNRFNSVPNAQERSLDEQRALAAQYQEQEYAAYWNNVEQDETSVSLEDVEARRVQKIQENIVSQADTRRMYMMAQEIAKLRTENGAEQILKDKEDKLEELLLAYHESVEQKYAVETRNSEYAYDDSKRASNKEAALEQGIAAEDELASNKESIDYILGVMSGDIKTAPTESPTDTAEQASDTTNEHASGYKVGDKVKVLHEGVVSDNWTIKAMDKDAFTVTSTDAQGETHRKVVDIDMLKEYASMKLDAKDKYQTQFREAVNEVLNREDEPKEQAVEKTEAEKFADQAREVAEEAKRNVDAADNAAPVAYSQEQKADMEQDIEPEAEVEAKKLNRTRKLGKWVTGLFSRTLGSERKSRRSAKRERKAELRNEREAKIAARGDEIYAERVAQHGQPGAYYENFEPTMERAQKDAKKEFSRFQKVREKTSDAKRVVGNAKNAFTETMAKERAERDNKSKESAVNEPEQPRSTPETKPMPTSEKPAPVTNLNGENLSPADLNTTQPLSRPENSEGEQKAA